MNYKLLVLDLDGTLTNSKKEITPFTRETLLQAQEKGLHLVLASGRPTYGIVPLAEELNIKQYGGFILSFNGGKVIDLMTDKVLFEQALPPDIVPVLYNRSKEAGLAILSYNGKYILSEHPENKYVQYESFLTKMKIKATDDFLRDLHQPADKCLVVGEPEMLVPLEEKLRQELGKRINVYRSEAFYLELVPKGIDKAASLSRLLERTRIKQGETYQRISFRGILSGACPQRYRQSRLIIPLTRANPDKTGGSDRYRRWFQRCIHDPFRRIGSRYGQRPAPCQGQCRPHHPIHER